MCAAGNCFCFSPRVSPRCVSRPALLLCYWRIRLPLLYYQRAVTSSCQARAAGLHRSSTHHPPNPLRLPSPLPSPSVPPVPSPPLHLSTRSPFSRPATTPLDPRCFPTLAFPHAVGSGHRSGIRTVPRHDLHTTRSTASAPSASRSSITTSSSSSYSAP